MSDCSDPLLTKLTHFSECEKGQNPSQVDLLKKVLRNGSIEVDTSIISSTKKINGLGLVNVSFYYMLTHLKNYYYYI